MKKNVLKAMSVGLSAITIASTLSVPVYADEAPAAEPTVPVGEVVAPAGESEVIPNKEDKNLDEKKAAEDANALDDRYYNDKDDFWEREKDKEVLDQVQDLEKAADDKNFPDGSSYEVPTLEIKPGHWFPTVGTKEVTFEETAEGIENEAELAGKFIEDAANQLDKNVAAAEGMDKAEAKAEAQVVIAEEATSAAAQAVGKADGLISQAAAAVDDTTVSTGTAQGLVNAAGAALSEAETALTEKKKEYDDAVAEYDKAKAEYVRKSLEYTGSKTAAAIELEAADQLLKDAKARVDELEKKVQEKQKEYAESAAGQLYLANDLANENFWTKYDGYFDYANVKAVIQYYIMDGQGATVTNIKDMNPYAQNPEKGDAAFEITYVDKDGKRQVAHYGFKFNRDGSFDIYDTEIKYEYEVLKKTPFGPVVETISKTQSQMEEMVTQRKAVKRYEFTDMYGKHYLTEDQLRAIGMNPTYFKASYVVIFGEGSSHDVWWDPMSPNETKVSEITRFGWFDADGNYNQTVIDATTKKFVKIINGQVSYEGTVDNAKTLKAVQDAAKAEFQEQLESATALNYVKVNGISGTDMFGNTITIKPSEILTIESVDVKWSDAGEIGIAWTVDGRYVPIYKKNAPCAKAEVKTDEFKLTDDWLRKYAGCDQIISEKEAKEYYQKENPNKYVKEVKFETDWYGYIKKATVYYVDTYEIEIGEEFDTREKALKAVENYAVVKQEGRDIETIHHDATRTFIGFIPFTLIPVYEYTSAWDETKINDTVVGAKTDGKYADKIVTDADYEGTGSYVAKVTYNVKDTATFIQHFNQELTDSLYRRTKEQIFNYREYAKRLDEIKKQTQSYQKLVKEAEEAKQALASAKKDVDKIQAELWALDKDFETFGNIKDWEDRLSLAKLQLENAQTRYDEIQVDLTNASNRLIARIAAEQQQQQQSSGGPTYRYNPTGITEIASIPAVIPEEAVPLAAPARRTRRIAGVVEEEPVEEVVEDTPAEEPEVTVEENENNPVVIDDEDVARAGGTQKSFFARTWWAWLLLVIAAIGGAVAYTKKKATDLK